MNKKDIAAVRKEFKSDSFNLRVKDIFTVYVKKETDEIFHQEYSVFSMLELEQQELFLQNFKKVLSGNLDEKLFEMKFDTSVSNVQGDLLDSITSDSNHWQELMSELVGKAFSDERRYKEDIIFTFIRAEYYISLNSKKKGRNSEDEGKVEKGVRESFIFCSMNKTTQPKKALLFDYIKKEFKSNLILDAMINLTSPIQGFMYPTIQQGGVVDKNRVLYSTSKKNLPDLHFVKSVLTCDTDDVVTSDSDVAYFNQVLINILGGKTNPKVISNVYHKIEKIVLAEREAEEDDNHDNEPVMLDHRDITNILVASGVELEDPQKIKQALKDVVDDEKYEFKAENLMTKKKITIDTEPVQLSVAAQNLQKVRQIHHEGKLCLLIEIDKNIEVNGLMMEIEKD